MIDDFKQPAREPAKIDTPGHPNNELLASRKNELRITPPEPKAAPDLSVLDENPTEATAVGAAEVETLNLDDTSSGAATPAPSDTKKRSKFLKPFSGWHRPNKKQALIIAAAVVLLAGGVTAFALTRPDAPVAAKKAATKAVVAPVVKPIISPLTGMTVTAVQQIQPVTGVMIENSPDARPQSGLKDAGVVYEAIAEGGITRFLALYQESAPANVGPIRSARPYYLDWLLPYDATLAHVGGSPDALNLIKSLGVKDLDQFANGGSYHRITTRYAPHNVYTGISNLVDLAKTKGWTSSSFTGFERKADQPYVAPAATPAGSTTKTTDKSSAAKPADSRTSAKSIDLNISGADYNAHYDYKADSNSYSRSEGGAAHMDADSNTQLEPKVVVALVMTYGLMADGKHSEYGTTGSGPLFVFQDGTVTTGTWTKADTKSQFKFTDAGGKALQLNAGQTWLSAVSGTDKVTSAP